MFRYPSRRTFGFGAIGSAVILLAASCLRADDAENANPATSPEEFRQQYAVLATNAAEVEQEVSALNRELNARYEEIDRNAEIQALRRQATETREATAAFLKTDATLVGLRQAREKALAEVEVGRRTLLDATGEAQALYKQRTDAEIQDAVLAAKIRETEFAGERHVLPRLYRDNEDLSAARERKEALRRQMQQARSDAENSSRDLKVLRAEADKARAASDAVRPVVSNDLYKVRAEKEAALRALIAETVMAEDKAVAEARSSAAKIRGDIAARDPESLALTEKLAGLTKQRVDLKKTRDEKQAALRALRAKAVADTTDNDREAALLAEKRLAEVDQQRAEIDYQIALAEFQMREGVGRRIGCDPEVRKAEAAVTDAEKARRTKEEGAVAIAAARIELEVLRRRIGEMEAVANAAPEVAAARAERATKEKALNDFRAKLAADVVADLSPAFAEASKTDEALRAKKLAEDEEMKALNRTKEEAARERAAVGARRQALAAELGKLYEKTADIESVKALRVAADAASKAYDQAYATSEIQKLLEAERDAAAALSAKTTELRKADEKCSTLSARIAAVREKGYAIGAAIRELGR